jgi:hypothetical protein
MLLSREAILTANDLKTTDVEVPEWGGKVRVSALTGTARDAFGRSLIGPDGKSSGAGYNMKLVAVSVVDENGTPLFTLSDVEELGKRSGAALQRVADAADKLNLLTADAVETATGN